MTTLYVGNLPYQATEDEIRAAFANFGSVTKVSVIMDRETGRPRGFAFVDMDEAGAKAAVTGLDGQQFGGRTLRINEARPREARPPRAGGAGGDSHQRRPAPRRDDHGGGY